VSDALDRFFDHYCRRRPVNATFTGVHAYDDQLPDWSIEGLAELEDDLGALGRELAAAHPPSSNAHALKDDTDLLDAELARAFLQIQSAENASGHGVRANPSLWSGEAIFSIVGLMTRDFAPLTQRMESARARLSAIPTFLAQAEATIGSREVPAPWSARARRECEGACILLTTGIERWIASADLTPASAEPVLSAARVANRAFTRFADWLNSRPAASENALSCGPELFDLLLARGHQCRRTRGDMLVEVRARFEEERVRLEEMARSVAGSWAAAQQQLATDVPVHDDYLSSFERTWDDCRRCAETADVVTWPDWPIRYVALPEWTRGAAPYLYYLFYRSPAPFDPYTIYDYVVPATPRWSTSATKLNHVVHHGAIGHHMQNWHAYHRAPSRIGQIAAVDCASRIGMFCGGTMAEGWACYATQLMEELGFLTPLERVSEQHSRVRFLARAIVDIELHQGTMSFEDAVRLYAEEVGIEPAAARAEAVKNSMFPCTALMYWLGTQSILDLRDTVKRQQSQAFSLKSFHDELLGYGSIPVPLITRLMTEPGS
jgi:hypothetical protein